MIARCSGVRDAAGYMEINPHRDCETFRGFHEPGVARTGDARIGMILAAVYAFCILFSSDLRAQIDESILPTQYRTTWNPGIQGPSSQGPCITGGIPADNDPCRPATVWLPAGNPYGGYSVNPADAGVANAATFTADFQAAVNAAGAAATPSSRKIVLLAPGTYFVNPPTAANTYNGLEAGIVVQVDDVTIRGSGATTTSVIAHTTQANPIPELGTLILFGHRSGFSDVDFKVENVTADALKGSTTIQVADASPYVVGDVIEIDHLDGQAAPDPVGGAAELNGGYLWFYDSQYFKRPPAYGWPGPSTGAAAVGSVTDLPSANTNAINVVPTGWRSTVQGDEITAISGNTLTLKDPLNIDFPLSLSPQVWRAVPLNTASIPVGNRWDGLEEIHIAGGNNLWGFPGGCTALSEMAYSWVKDVDADGDYSSSDLVNHPGKYGDNIALGKCYRCEVTSSYAHGATDENPGGQSYGITIGNGSSQDLVDNNISINNDKPIIMIKAGGGNVISYNYVDESELWGTPTWLESSIDDSHNSFDHNDLIEGNWAANLGNDGTHGNIGWDTHFRNYSNGNNLHDPKSANLRAVTMAGYSGPQAYIGNVLKGGTVYQVTQSSPNGTPIYQIGFLGGSIGWDDGYATTNLYRDANWDNVTGHIVWNNQPETIPNSLYLTAPPAFFAGYTWPWVNPLTGTTLTLPAKARYDSGNIFPPPPTFTYTLANGGSKSVTRGSSVTQTVTSTLTSGTAQSVSYTVSGLPTGATLSFPACTPNCTKTGTLTTASSTPVGTYTITVTGAPNNVTTSFTLTVNAAFTYILANGGSKSVARGSSVTQTVTATLTGGTAQSVSYAVSGLPAGATLSFPACAPTCTSTGTLATTSSTPVGAYTITVTGAPNSVTTSFTLTVTTASGGGISYIQTVKTLNNNRTPTFTSSSITTSSGDLLVVALAMWSQNPKPPMISSIKLDGATSFTVDKDQIVTANGEQRIVIASLPNVPAGTHTITVTAAGNVSVGSTLFVSEFSGTVLASPVDGTGAAIDGWGTTPASSTFTTTASNDLWVSAFTGNSSTTSLTAATGWTVPANGANLIAGNPAGPQAGFEYRIASGQTSGNGSFTITSNANWAAAAIAYKSR